MTNRSLTSLQFSYNLMLLTFGTTASIQLDYDDDSVPIPSTNQHYVQLDLSENDNLSFVKAVPMKNEQKLEALRSFSNNLVKNSLKIDSEIQSVINDNLWDII